MLAQRGSGAAVVLQEVVSGSSAEKAGLRAGQQLLAISDPIRATELMRLNDRPSMNFINTAIRMRRIETVDMEITSAPVMEVAKQEPDSEDASGPTIREQLMQQQAAGSGQQTAYQRRKQRRQEYMEQTTSGSNPTLFAIMFGAIVLPVIVILGIAVSTGYLDQLSGGYRMSR
jgi:hypothetical protein